MKISTIEGGILLGRGEIRTMGTDTVRPLRQKPDGTPRLFEAFHFVVEAIPPSHREKANDPKDDHRRNHEDQDTIPEGGDAPNAGCRGRVVTQSTTLSQNGMRDGEARHGNR
jgi:hypothetical protein